MSSVQLQWEERSTQGINYYELPVEPGLLLLFFTRRGGVSHAPYESLNLSFDVGDKQYHVEENYRRIRQALRLPALTTFKQTHSDTVLPIAYEKTPPDLIEGDAAFTGRANLGLGLKVADCLPVYLFARDRRCVGIAHCGWRGTVSRIAEKTARAMSRRFAVPLPDLRFALGPCICPECYPVGPDVRDEFLDEFPGADKFLTPLKPGRNRVRFALDLRSANRWLLKEMGLVEAASLDVCTHERDDLFFSARRESPTGRNLALIALRT